MLALATVTGIACGGDGKNVEIRGAIEKGPFVQGSEVLVAPLDGNLAPTGDVFSTMTSDDLGRFQVTVERSEAVRILGTGFYYNESTGMLSGAQLSLRALYLPTTASTQDAYVNLVTHLTYERVATLVLAGAAFDAAVAQAERELRLALDITVPSFEPSARGVEMSLSLGATTANAYLFAVGTVLTQAAVLRSEGGGSIDANLQELLNTLSTDLAQDGTISSALAAELDAAALAIDTAVVEAALAQRFAMLGSNAAVPDLDSVLDQDDDGLVNASDNCPRTPNPDQANEDRDATGDACDECPSTPCAGGQGCLLATRYAGLVEDRCIDVPGSLGCASGSAVGAAYVLLASGTEPRALCAATCDPADAGSCASGSVCLPAVGGSGASVWACVPQPAGTVVPVRGQCAYDAFTAHVPTCASGSVCHMGFCVPVCDEAEPTSCGAGLGTCAAPFFGAWPGGATTPGVCDAFCTDDGVQTRRFSIRQILVPPSVADIGATGLDIDAINNASVANGGMGATVAGCGRTDSPNGVDNALAAIDASLSSSGAPPVFAHLLRVAAFGGPPFELEISGWNGTANDGCVVVSLYRASEAAPLAAVATPLVNGSFDARFGGVALPLATRAPAYEGPLQCTGPLRSCPMFELPMTLHVDALHVDLQTPSLNTVLPTSVIGGRVFYGPAATDDPGSFTSLASLADAVASYAAATQLSQPTTGYVVGALGSNRDVRLSSNGLPEPCSGPGVGDTNRNAVSAGFLFTSNPSYCVEDWDCPTTLCESYVCTQNSCVVDATTSCDDGLACTADRCDPMQGCVADPLPGYCVVGGECLSHGQVSSSSACHYCDVSQPTTLRIDVGAQCSQNASCCPDGMCGC